MKNDKNEGQNQQSRPWDVQRSPEHVVYRYSSNKAKLKQKERDWALCEALASRSAEKMLKDIGPRLKGLGGEEQALLAARFAESLTRKRGCQIPATARMDLVSALQTFFLRCTLMPLGNAAHSLESEQAADLQGGKRCSYE